jgi:hypothetical protein
MLSKKKKMALTDSIRSYAFAQIEYSKRVGASELKDPRDAETIALLSKLSADVDAAWMRLMNFVRDDI